MAGSSSKDLSDNLILNFNQGERARLSPLFSKRKNMATKVYGISGYTTTVIRIPAGNGKAWIECEFTRGYPNGAYQRPATFVTSDATIQNIIEHSKYFGRLIRIVRSSGNAAATPKPIAKVSKTTAAPEPVEEAPKEEAAIKEMPEVTTYEEAISSLKALGAKATQLKSIASAKKFMEQHNVIFPNYNFE